MKPEDGKIFNQTKYERIEGELPEKTAYEWQQKFMELVGNESMNKVSGWETKALEIFTAWQKRKVTQAKKDFKKKYPDCDLHFSDPKINRNNFKNGVYTADANFTEQEMNEYSSIMLEKNKSWRNYPSEDIDDINAQNARVILEKIDDVQRAIFTQENNAYELPVRCIHLGLAVAKAHASFYEYDVGIGQRRRKTQTKNAKYNRGKQEKAKTDYQAWQELADIYFKRHPNSSKPQCAEHIKTKLKPHQTIGTIRKKIINHEK